ncbi:MAG: hypothetical protein R3F43_30715 [bacterium]
MFAPPWAEPACPAGPTTTAAGPIEAADAAALLDALHRAWPTPSARTTW